MGPWTEAERRALLDYLQPGNGAEQPASPDEWVQGLRPFGERLGDRAVLAAVQEVLPCWQRIHMDDPRPREALLAAIAYHRGKGSAVVMLAAGESARSAWEEARKGPPPQGALEGAFRGAEKVAWACFGVTQLLDPTGSAEKERLAVRIVGLCVAAAAGSAWTALAAWNQAEARVRRAMVESVLPLVAKEGS